MFELYATNFVKVILFPPGSIWLLLLFGLLFMRRSIFWGKRILIVTLITGYLISIPLVSGLLLKSLDRYPAIPPSQLEQFDAQAIVVLSAGLSRNNPEYGGEDIADYRSLIRLRYGAYIRRHTELPIIVSGGKVFDQQDDSLASVMANSLKNEFNIADIWLEDKSQTTEENARLTQQLLEGKGISRIFLVTHSWHMPRAVTVFEKYGLDVIPAPTDSISISDSWLTLILPRRIDISNAILAPRRV